MSIENDQFTEDCADAAAGADAEFLMGLVASLAAPPEGKPNPSRWKKGRSGNPLGRPRRSAAAAGGPAPRNLQIERALKRQVETTYPGGMTKRVSLVEMLINELTQMVQTDKNVAAARELLYWVAATDRSRAESSDRDADSPFDFKVTWHPRPEDFEPVDQPDEALP